MIDLNPLDTYIRSCVSAFDEAAGWTPPLRQAVTRYLKQLPDRSFDAIVREALEWGPEKQSRSATIDAILATNEPGEAIRAAHWMAVRAVPSLEKLALSLVGHDATESYMAMGEWLDKNATVQERSGLIHELDPAYFFILCEVGGQTLYVTDWLEEAPGPVPTPEQLLMAWKRVRP